MNEAKHTPGPWSVDESNAIVGEKLDDHPIWLRPVIARFATGVRPADTRLMAAAPELLEALRGLDEAYCRSGENLTREERAEDRRRLIAARAAIAKATGK